MSVELHHLRAFLAVAEHLSFTRAAAALHLAQPALSQTVRRLERELGVQLFVRTTRSVELSQAGQSLLTPFRRAVSCYDEAITTARRISGAAGTVLRLGFHPGGVGSLLAELLRAFASTHPHVDIDLRRLDWGVDIPGLSEGVLDAALVRPPVDLTGLRAHTLLRDQRVVGLALGHRLAQAEHVDILDLADEPTVHGVDAPDELQNYWTVNPRPDGRAPRLGPRARTNEEMLEHVALGSGVCLVPPTLTEHYTRSDIVFRPVTGIPACPLLFVTGTQPTPLAAAFTRSALAVTARGSIDPSRGDVS